MFGKPQWFAPKKFGWGLRPVTKEGWIYAGVWCAVLILPFVGMLLSHKWLEAIIWIAAMIGFLIVDVKMILRAMQRREEEREVFRIMDEEETRHETAETGKFAMHVTDSHAPKQQA